MDNARLIKKIRNLFALAADKNSQGNESENAMRMANKLLEKHAISMLDLHEKDEVGITITSNTNAPWVRTVYGSICRLYNCKYILDHNWDTPKHLIIGTESNRVTAEIVITHLIKQIYDEAKGKGAAFRNGAVESLSQTCNKMIKERQKSTEEVMPGTGLVPLDIMKQQSIAMQEFVELNFGNLGKIKNNTKSSQAGRDYGTGLNPGARVSGGTQRMLR